jgi:hypothetical protein
MLANISRRSCSTYVDSKNKIIKYLSKIVQVWLLFPVVPSFSPILTLARVSVVLIGTANVSSFFRFFSLPRFLLLVHRTFEYSYFWTSTRIFRVLCATFSPGFDSMFSYLESQNFSHLLICFFS